MAAPRVDASRHALPPTLVDVAGDRLRDAILSGALRPGEKLVEERLCSEFGISRAPLREALRLLAQQGLVEQMPRRGSRVADCSPSDVRALFALRHVLECHAIDTTLPRPDLESALAPVRAALDDMASAGDELARDDAHRRFHATVTGLAGNRQLDLTLAPILLKLQLPMARNLRTEAKHTDTDGIARHRAILTALQTNDPAVVIAALADHGHLRYIDLPPER